MNDASIRKVNSRGNSTNDNDYSVEVVSPILTETDIDTMQIITRALRTAGGKTNELLVLSLVFFSLFRLLVFHPFSYTILFLLVLFVVLCIVGHFYLL